MSLIVSTILSDPLEDLLELLGLNSSLTSLEGLRDVKAESYSLEAFLDELSESCEEWVLVILLSPSVLKEKKNLFCKYHLNKIWETINNPKYTSFLKITVFKLN